MFPKFIPCAFQSPISILPHEGLLGLDRLQVKETWTRREKQKLRMLPLSVVQNTSLAKAELPKTALGECFTPPASPSASCGTAVQSHF